MDPGPALLPAVRVTSCFLTCSTATFCHVSGTTFNICNNFILPTLSPYQRRSQEGDLSIVPKLLPSRAVLRIQESRFKPVLILITCFLRDMVMSQ